MRCVHVSDEGKIPFQNDLTAAGAVEPCDLPQAFPVSSYLRHRCLRLHFIFG